MRVLMSCSRSGGALAMFLTALAGCTFSVSYPAEDAFIRDTAQHETAVDAQRHDTNDVLTDRISPPDSGEIGLWDGAGETGEMVVPPDADDTVLPEVIEPDLVEPDIEVGECETKEDCQVLYGEVGPCLGYVCQGSPSTCETYFTDAPCDDADPCTVDDACFEGMCMGMPLGCLPVDCHEVMCDQEQGCLYLPTSGGFCDDGDVCSMVSKCEDGMCLGSDWLDCGTDTECEKYWCDPIGGCQEAVIPNCGQCYQEGTGYNVDFGGFCCAGLSPIADCDMSDVGCTTADCLGMCNCSELNVVCANCGDGVCGQGENVCNCGADCLTVEPTTCAEAGGTCYLNSCPGGYVEIAYPGCGSGFTCCEKNEECIPLYQVGFYGKDSCCAGQDISLSVGYSQGNSCSVSTEEFVCSPCGNGNCNIPHEDPCNCPDDCTACTSYSDCPFFKGCIGGICLECGMELCDDGISNDCDSQIDEAICVGKECKGMPSLPYEHVPFQYVIQKPQYFDEQNIAMVARVRAGQATCSGLTCTAPLLLEESLQGKTIRLVGSSQYPTVQCKGQLLNPTDPFDLVDCSPVDPTKTYVVWGLFDGEDVNSAKLYLMGFCEN